MSKSAPIMARSWPSLARATAVTIVALLAALAAASTVQAAITHIPDSSFEVKSPGKVAVDEEIGAVYVSAGEYGSYVIEKFDEEGHPWDFSGTGNNQIDLEHISGVPTPEVREIAVDNSGGPNAGDLYVGRLYYGESEKEGALVFSRTGDFLAATGRSSLKKKFPALNAWPGCGTAVDRNGDFYVAHGHGEYEYKPSYIDKYHPTGAWILGAIPEQEWPIAGTMGGPEHEPGIGRQEACEIGVDANNALYIRPGYNNSSDELRFYAPSKFGLDNPSFRLVTPSAVSFNVDQLTNDVYVAENLNYERNRIRRYDEHGTLIETFGEGEVGQYPWEVSGIAFDAASSKVYVTSGPYEGNKVTIYKGVVTPDVENVVSEAEKTTATVSATVNPIGAGNITECELEYGTESGSYVSSVPCSPDPSGSPFTGAQAVTASLSGLEKETTYHYRFAVTNANGTTKDVDRTFTTHNVADVETEGVSGVTKTDATLHGSFTGDGNPTEYWFEWTIYKSPTEPEYEHQTAAQTTSTAGHVDATADIIGELAPYLPQDGPYHYRLVAKNSLGDISRGPDRTFHSLPPDRPTISGTAASEVTEGGAKLSAMIDPEEGATVYAFEWGISSEYGSTTLVNGPIGEDSVAHAVESTVGELEPGTVYHFRAVAINFGGTTYGPDMTFKTAGTSGVSGAAGSAATTPAPTPKLEEPTPKSTKCRKGFVKRHGKCVRKKHHHHHRHHHRRGSKRG